jgi:isocitrate lyase
MLLIARTDSESAKLLSSSVDADDHEFILGTTSKVSKGLAQVLSDAEARGATGAEVDALEQQWTEKHPLCTFNQGWRYFPSFVFIMTSPFAAVETAIAQSSIENKDAAYKSYLAAVEGKSNSEAREVATDILGKPVFWDWDREYSPRFLISSPDIAIVPRTREGYCHVTGGIEVITIPPAGSLRV